MADFLLEIRCEELPAGYVEVAFSQVRRKFRALLKKNGLRSAGVVADGTPRRIVLGAKGLPDGTPSRETEIRGPSEETAFKNGATTKAADGFAAKHGVSPDEIQVRETPKGRYCYISITEPGRPTAEVLAEWLPRIIASISFPKSMRWTSREQTFGRPIRNLLALLGTQVVEFEYAGVKSGRRACGHPFLAPEPFEVPKADFDSFVRTLEDKYVIVSLEARKRLLREQIIKHLQERRCVFPEEDEDLLNEVTNMVEWPNIIEGSFYESFLDLPAEVLVAAMKEHQRYFPERTAEGKLRPNFLTAIDQPETHADIIRRGHENVLKARLADARFFFEADCRVPFTKRVEELKGVTFQEKLGSYYDKAQRLRNFAGTLGRKLGLSPKEIVALQQAAQLAKADLVTRMVAEFPSLQGVVGTEYARRGGLPEPVADAIAEHYLPRRAGDRLPQTTFGRILSLTDKLDNIAAFFSINLLPTGSADPFGLRRQAAAIIRIVWDAGLPISLRENFSAAVAEMPVADSQKKIALAGILDFFKERLSNMLIEEGHRYDIVEALLASGFDNLNGLRERLAAIEEIAREDYWEGLCEIVERTFNIYRDTKVSGSLNQKLLKEKEEKELASVYRKVRPKVNGLIEKGDYTRASKAYYDAFAKPVHAFFDKVFVNVEDEALRKNRMLLNRQINRLYVEHIADLSRIVFEGKQ